MQKRGFLTAKQRQVLEELARDGLAEHRLARRANALILLDRGMSYHQVSAVRPQAVPPKMNPAKQRQFIAEYEALMRGLPDDEIVMFSDAVHPVHGAQPVGCWAPAGEPIAVAQTTGRERLNIQEAIDLDTGDTDIVLVDQVDAASTIALLEAIEARYPKRRKIHV